jgi:hypothetical protein
MRQHDVHALACGKPLDLIVSVVAPGVALKRLRIHLHWHNDSYVQVPISR